MSQDNLEGRIWQLRHDYMSCLKLCRETDSKKEEAHLKSEAADILKELRALCIHSPTVCLCSEYEGSSCMDYDDRHSEHRICLCCGVEEYAYSNKWKTLTTVPFSRFESKHPAQIINPLSYLLTETIEVAESQGYRYFVREVFR